MKKEILDFIKRRFSKDCNWTNGNCYWFAYILCSRFHFLHIYYFPVIGHFVAGSLGTFYDWNGIVELEETAVLFDEIKEVDCLFYDRLIRDCMM